uniref:Uncharacterized protein n=1 Tax=Physcomitrium patens TaxID=3218 RepID=A0A7I4FIM6_PHYPA|nr:nucleolin-like [Physcomitrium patens]XP_024366075.1 nucleolin-like [Physcomitrium patens]|eukprot:XP_024366074.1 nucleolin-like [Physcomitrella patens]
MTSVDQDSPAGEEASAPRRPKFETKNRRKPAAAGQTAEADLAVLAVAELAEPAVQEPELEVIPELGAESEPVVPMEVKEEEEEEEEDWDAKSFEEVNLPSIKSAFAEEEADDGPVKAGQVVIPPPSALPAVAKPSPRKKPAPPSKSQAKVVESEDENGKDEGEDEDSEEGVDVRKRQEAKVRRKARIA